MKTVDCRGKACPEPVVRAKKAIECGDTPFVLFVDEGPSIANVTRLVRKLGCSIEQGKTGDGWVELLVSGPAHSPDATATEAAAAEGGPVVDQPAGTRSGEALSATVPGQAARPRHGTVVYLSSNRIGRGDDKLGSILMRAFLKTLCDMDDPPPYVVCLNSGVRLAVEGSQDSLKALSDLAARGTEILVCGTCLDYFGLKDSLAAGRVSNMFEILEILDGAGKVISP